MEQKTYWWRIVLIAVCVIILTGAYIGPCEYNFGKCIGGNSILVVRSLFHFSLSFLLVSPALFFVVDFGADFVSGSVSVLFFIFWTLGVAVFLNFLAYICTSKIEKFIYGSISK